MLNKPFFDAVRKTVFGGHLSQGQVNGLENIAEAWGLYGDGNLQREAYVFATPVIETAGRMEPIYEYGSRRYFDKYEPNTNIGKRLGNIRKGDGFTYRGRGLVQITGRANYARVGNTIGVDLVNHPDLALDPKIAARILVEGELHGWFTGKGLSNYIDNIDESDAEDLREYVAARRTVNGQDRALEIGKIALHFEEALKLL